MKDLYIRPVREADTPAIVDLWTACSLTVPWNDPIKDIERKTADSPELFFVGEMNGNRIVATCMAGYDGHRGWVYYLGVLPELQEKGIGAAMMSHAETALKQMGCPKVELMVRRSNAKVLSFYDKDGYEEEPVVVLSKRLIED